MDIILSARRSYEFAMDALRLTMLTNASFLGHFQDTFQFAGASVEPPDPTFGPVPMTTPPGLVFQGGLTESDDGTPTPIRFIHFEPQRIVISAAGPSSLIAPVYDAIRTMLQDVRAPDGSPALGMPTHTLDYSEVVTTLDMSPAAMLAPELSQLFVDASGTTSGVDLMAVPRWEIHVQTVDAEYGPSYISGDRAFRFEIRPGTKPSERRFYSGAPLDTDAHFALLRRLEAMLGKGGAQRRRAKAR